MLEVGPELSRSVAMIYLPLRSRPCAANLAQGRLASRPKHRSGGRSSETPACGGRSRASGGGSFCEVQPSRAALRAELFLGLFAWSPMPRESATGYFRVESCSLHTLLPS